MKNKKIKLTTLNLSLIAMFVAIIAICSWISIPLVVPITLQTFAVFVSLGLLGGIRGTIVILIYILLGMVGVPVFASFNSGIGYLLGPTGGFIFGFLLIGILYIILEIFIKNKTILYFVSCIIGLLLCYLMGSIWFSVVYSNAKKEISMISILSTCVFPFIIPDLIKISLGYLITYRLYRYVPNNISFKEEN